MSLVIKKWFANEVVNEEKSYVHLFGREEGLISWALSLLKIDPTTELKVSDDIITYSSSSFAGTEHRIIPIKSISSVSYAYEKPWKMALFLTVLLISFMGLGLIVGALYYYFNRSLTVAVNENSGYTASFSFSPSFIEGVDVNENEAKRVVLIITKLLSK